MRAALTLICLALVASCQAASERAEGDSAPIEVEVGELVYCRPVEQEVTPRDCELAILADEQAAAGLATLKYSKFMTVGDVSSVSMVIDRGYSDAAPSAPEPASATVEEPVPTPDPAPAEVEDPTPPPPPQPPEPSEREPDVTVTYHPIVGRFTSARLEGVDFDISPREAVTKEIPRGGQEGWDWRLTPLRQGTLTFRVITNVQFKRTDGTYMALAQKAEPYEVTVGVGFLSRVRVFLEGLPEWIGYLTAILTAVTAFFVAWFSLRRVFQRPRDTTVGDAEPPSDES